MPRALPLLTPFHSSGLTNTQNVRLGWGEQILAYARLPAECMSITCWGLLIEQTRSRRCWHPEPRQTEHCHLLTIVELDCALGIFALSTRTVSEETPPDQYIAICSWPYRSAAAEHLWSYCLGPVIAERYFGLEKHLAETISALGLEEQPVNHQPPGYSMTRHGALLRFDAAMAPNFNRYFLLDEPTTEPASIELGADCSLIYVYSDDPVEPARAMITDNAWSARMARKELGRSVARKSKEISTT